MRKKLCFTMLFISIITAGVFLTQNNIAPEYHAKQELVYLREPTVDDMNEIVKKVSTTDFDKISAELGSASPKEYISAFLNKDPEIYFTLKEIDLVK